MDYTTLLCEIKESQDSAQIRMHSLYEVCRQMPDGRKARGKRYDVTGLLVVLGASEWIQDQEELLREGLGLSWKRMPSANTYSYALARLDSQAVNAHLAAWLVRKEAESRCGEEPSRLAAHPSERHVHLAIDGKALKGTGAQASGGEDPQKHLVHVYEVQTGIVLHQCPIAEKRNEVSALKPLLTEVVCKGRILTADAAQSYHEFGRLVQRAGGDVIVIVKNNTPVTRAGLEETSPQPASHIPFLSVGLKVLSGHPQPGKMHIQRDLCSAGKKGCVDLT